MSYLRSAILGIVQGVTEFLPVSSSGHLAIFGRGEGDFGLYAIVMFHLGTLLAILVYYRRDVLAMALGAFRLVAGAFRAVRGSERLGEFLKRDAGARLAFMVAVGSVPTAAVGLTLRELAGYAATDQIKLVGAFFIITAVLVYLCDRLPVGFKGLGGSSAYDAFVVGIFQGMAVLPGLSRSGLTIFAGVMRGVSRRDAAKLSFLMAIPAMLGALILEGGGGAPAGSLGPALVGAGVAFVAGYVSIVFLIKLLARRRLRFFAGYLLILGVSVLVWLN